MKRPSLRLRTKTKLTIIAVAFASAMIFYVLFFFLSATPKQASAANELLSSGSFIINMGNTPQTVNNGLKPYGMVYDLIVNYNVPVKWVIEPTKVKDGTDFTYNAIAYKGGPFIIPAEYINSTIQARITYWTGQGVSGVYTTSAITVPVAYTLTNFPKSIIDDESGKSGIIIAYYDDAMIPSSAYTVGMASSITGCSDLWINPHGDPSWATHSYLYSLATSSKSFIWCQCHAVSVMEGIKNPVSPFQQLNFLSTTGLKCYNGGSCGTIAETHGANATAPFTYFYPTDPIMQFIGTMSGATTAGSERWYQPVSTGAWRGTTKIMVASSDGSGSGVGTIMAYGPAYGDASNGLVMYTGGHDLDNGSTQEKVAAKRSFFNFVLLAGFTKQVRFTEFNTPATVPSTTTVNVAATVTSGTGPYTYQWTSTVGGTFANPNSAVTTFTAPYTNTPLTGALTCTVIDACSRRNFASNPVGIPASTLPISLKSFSGFYKDKKVTLSWLTATEINNDYFEISRSVDGIEYTTIGTERGNGNSTMEIAYNFVDKDYPAGHNIIYYKLRQFDINGNSEEFDPIAVRLDDSQIGVAEVMPNPFTSTIRIDYYSTQPQKVSITLMNNGGQIVLTKTVNCAPGFTPIDLNDLDILPSGVYFIVLSDSKKQKMTRIVKL